MGVLLVENLAVGGVHQNGRLAVDVHPVHRGGGGGQGGEEAGAEGGGQEEGKETIFFHRKLPHLVL